MIIRPATPADGPDMLRLIESHPTGGNIKLLYSRRPDAYRSYKTECAGAETILCIGENNRLLAQATCLPRRLYIDKKVCTLGYITGLYKTTGTQVNIMKLLDAGYVHSVAKQFFCSILDDNKSAFDLFDKRGLIYPICDYTTYLINPAAIKPIRHEFKFRRATSDDTDRLLSFYNEAGAMHSYFPVFSSMDDFPELTVTDFFILEDGDSIIAAGALWNQQAFKQYIALGYDGVYRLAALCNPVLRALHYPSLPKVNEAAHFAYISFILPRENNFHFERILLGEISNAARKYSFLTIGAVKGTVLGKQLDLFKNIKIGSRLCAIDYPKSGVAESGVVESIDKPPRFECALL